jgi:hypothetical protein
LKERDFTAEELFLVDFLPFVESFKQYERAPEFALPRVFVTHGRIREQASCRDCAQPALHGRRDFLPLEA